MTIREAMNILSFALFSEDYEMYLYGLFPEEIIQEKKDIETAWAVVENYGLGWNEIKKHWERYNNIAPDPVRFIDRPPFIAVETDQLPF